MYDGAEFVINYLTRWGGSVEVAGAYKSANTDSFTGTKYKYLPSCVVGEAVRLPVCPYATGPMIRGEIGGESLIVSLTN